MDTTTIYTGIPCQKTTGTDPQPGPSSNPKTQTNHSTQQLTGVTGMTQTSPVRSTQIDGMQTTPPNCPGKTTSSGGTQTSPPRPSENNRCNQGTQGQPDHNEEAETDAQSQGGKSKGSKGKKGKNKSPEPSDPCPGTSSNTEPKRDFTSRNLDTGRPSIQCSLCDTYNHWNRMCRYDNFCTTCNDHSHTTHMCRAPKDSPVICIYCDNSNHRSGNCPNKPLDNREQSCEMPEALKNQQNQHANIKILGNATRNATSNATGQVLGHPQQDDNPKILGNATSNHANYQQSSSSSRQTKGNQSSQRENTVTGTGRYGPRGTQGQTNGSFP